MAKVSIALATYNGENFIVDQIESIFSQSFQDFEIIIHDDCSNDRTVEILKKYEAKDNRIHLSKNEKNLGFAKNFENIVHECKGKYIAFADQDDIWTENHLEILLDIIGNKDVACGNALLVDETNNSLKFTMQEVIGIKKELKEQDICWRLFFDNFVQGTAMLVKKELCEKYLPVPEIVKFHDYWLALVASLNNGVSYTQDIVLRYRQHGNNVTNNKKNSLLREIYNCISGFNIKRFRHQEEILCCLEEVFGNNRKEIMDSKKFYHDCSRNKIDKFDKQYFKEHYCEMFLTNKHYILRKIIYQMI